MGQFLEFELKVGGQGGAEEVVRVRMERWCEYEVVAGPSQRLGQGRELKLLLVQAMAEVGAQAVPRLIEALGDGDLEVRRAVCEALGRIGDAQAVPALSVLAQVGNEAAQEALQQMGQSMMSLEEAVGELVQQGWWGVVIRTLDDARVRKLVVGLGAAAVPKLIEALGDGDWEVRRAACWALGQIGDTQAVPALIKAAKDNDSDVREAACWALGQMGDAAAVPTLLEALTDEEGIMCVARQALRKIKNKEAAIPALLQGLKDQNKSIRIASYAMLYNLDTPDSLLTLLHHSVNADNHISHIIDNYIAKHLLKVIGMKVAVGTLIKALKDEHIRKKASALLGWIGEAAASALIEALKDEDENIRQAAAEVLNRMRNAQAVPKQMKALADENASVRRAACGALGEIWSATESVSSLIRKLEDRDEDVRRAACEALGKMGAVEAVPALIKRISDKNWSVRREACWALGAIGDVQAVPKLIERLRDRDESWSVREAACGALGRIWSATESVSSLIQKLEDGNEYVRRAAAEALGQIGVAAMPLLIQAAQNKNLREAVVQVLGKIGVAAVPKLIEALQDRQTYVRTLACTALGVIGDGQAVPALLSTLQDPKAEVRRAAQKALQQIEAKGLTSS